MFRSNTAHSPERLEPCQTPRETRRSKRLGRVYPLDLKRPYTLSPDLLRDTYVKGASAPARLDCRPLDSCDPSYQRPEMLPANSCTPRFSKTSTRAACGYRPAQGLPMRPLLHGFGLASAGLPGARLGACHTELTSQEPTSDALVTGRRPRLLPSPPSDQRRFRRHLVKDSGFHDTERLQPGSSPPRALCFSPCVATRRSLSTSLRSWLAASS